MNDVEYVEDSKYSIFRRTKSRLEFAYEIMAFINTYGYLYDKYYFALILNLNNIIEHYLITSNDKIIMSLYLVYSRCKESKKTDKEIYKELREEFYHLPVYTIGEVEQRRLRHK